MCLYRKRLSSVARSILASLFLPAVDPWTHSIHLFVLIGLYVAGLWLWGYFFSWGNIAFDFLDWAEVTGPRLALLQDAANQAVLPLHSANLTALRAVTDRFLSIPDTPISPQFFFLRVLSLGQYVFYDTLLFYSAGYIGLVLIYRKYKLSPLLFGVLFILFNWNGYITGHLAVGHSIWTAYFLLPFIVFLILELLEGKRVGWRWIAGIALIELVILLQGFFHLFIWILIFLAIIAVVTLRYIRPLFWAGFFSVLLGFPRLLPPALVLESIKHEFLGGFPSVADLFASMIVLRDPDQAVRLLTDTLPLGPWEVDYYVGLLGFLFIVLFGLVRPLLTQSSPASVTKPVMLTSLIFAALSIGEVYEQLIRFVPVPLFVGERVTSRMWVLPLVILMICAAISAQRWVAERKLTVRAQLVSIGLAAMTFHDLNQHLQAWRVRQLDSMVYLFPKVPFDRFQHTIANHADSLYTNLLIGGVVVSAVALVILLWLAARDRENVRDGSAPSGLD